ncbi:MAG: hypothetical protein ABW133_25615 [Polyangiaceae bacterium]
METAFESKRGKWWPSVRAALILLAIVVGLVDGAPIPTPRVMDRLSPPMRDAAMRLREWQALLLTPFRPIKETFAVSQRWSVFATTGGTRYRMRIEARAGDGPWTLLFRIHDPEHALLSSVIGYRRVKNVYNPSRSVGVKGSYPAFATWIARSVFRDEKAFDEVRVSMERGQILEEGAGFEPLGEFDYVEVRQREVVR